MKNTIGDNLTLTLFGESHGEYIGAVLDGVTPGIKVDEDFINFQLARRRPQGKLETARVEKDEYILASGVPLSYLENRYKLCGKRFRLRIYPE